MEVNSGKVFLLALLVMTCLIGSILCKYSDSVNTDFYDDEESTINDNYEEILTNTIRHRHNRNHQHRKESNQRGRDHQKRWKESRGDFVIVDNLSDGEMERRISFGGLTAKETSIGNNSHSLTLWQLTDGKAFFQAIFNGDQQLLDCEYVRQREVVRHFVRRFYSEIDQTRYKNQSSSPYIPHKHKLHLSDHQFREYVENGYLSEENAEDLEQNFGISVPFDTEVSSAGLRNLTMIRINSEHELPSDLKRWMDVKQLQGQCNKRHQQLKEMAFKMQSKEESERIEGEEQLNRQKRALSDWLLAPNTKWCGRGTAADKYSELGGNSRADMCCRKHDHCKFTIKGMSTKWNLFNFRPYTLSHCSCDLRFRTCLKMADSADANMVGRVFFNVLQTKCFVLKPEKVCKEHSWWGKCVRKGIRKRAHLRDNRKF